MEKHPTLFVILIFTTLFTLLFHQQLPGLNLLIFELICIIYLILSKSINQWTRKIKLIFVAQIVTCLATVMVYSNFSFIIHFLISIIFIGMLIYPNVKSPLTSIELSFLNLISAQGRFYKKATQVQIMNKKPAAFLWDLRLFIIPSAVIFIFITIYNFANPKFNEMTSGILSGLFEVISDFFNHYDLSIALTIMFGVMISNTIFLRHTNAKIIEKDILSVDFLTYISSGLRGEKQTNSIKNEVIAAIFLLSVLNISLLAFNIIDINWVWFGFEWQGQYLKQFVHEGTWLLIMSIMLSIIIILYFFRGDINFIENKLLKYLGYFWIVQNLVLAISAGIRNYYYIEYFNLAYKRVGVFIFLIMTIYGLYTVFRKVRFKHSASYLIRTNMQACLLILTISSLFNWDVIIARYNFNHHKSAFVHFNYLATLSDKSLPFLNRSLPELHQIEISQQKTYPREKSYMSAEDYFNRIEFRKNKFRTKWEKKSWLSWNLPEQLAYTKLQASEKW